VIPTLTRAYEASAALAAFKIAKFSDVSATSKVAPAAANTDPLMGVNTAMAAATGDMADIVQHGIGLVVLGGTVTAGAELTSDASGAAIAAVPTAGVFMSVVGKALSPGVAGDVSPGVLILTRAALQNFRPGAAVYVIEFALADQLRITR